MQKEVTSRGNEKLKRGGKDWARITKPKEESDTAMRKRKRSEEQGEREEASSPEAQTLKLKTRRGES